MTTAVDLSETQLQQLLELTNEKDIAAALRTALTEYIRYAKRMRSNGADAGGGQVPKDNGTESVAEDSHSASGHDASPTDAWMDAVEAIAAQGDPQDDLRLEAAIQAIRHQQKEVARKKLGLEP